MSESIDKRSSHCEGIDKRSSHCEGIASRSVQKLVHGGYSEIVRELI
jgi:hypothetical protein